MIHYFKSVSWQEALPLFLVENLLVILLALGFGYVLQWLFRQHKLPEMTFGTISRREALLASMTLVINTLITYAGFLLWRLGIIHIGEEITYKVLLDFALLFLGMDFLMYVFHYGIHKTFLHRYIH
ncbi:MAG: fatty acid hydroxylase family protein, partial [Bacteroidota bacterium]